MLDSNSVIGEKTAVSTDFFDNTYKQLFSVSRYVYLRALHSFNYESPNHSARQLISNPADGVRLTVGMTLMVLRVQNILYKRK
jgi:hypothetical protein